ncbi:MAG: DUF262 domain-containing protein [Acinetobacter sp.]
MQLDFDKYIDEDNTLLKSEEELFEEEDDDETPPIDIIAFNELRSCADLHRMYKSNQLTIDPDFQRNLVWSAASKSKFIDSLAKQLPIPSMCISLDYKSDKRLVIDGLQRISTIVSFLNEETWVLSNIKDIDVRLRGRTPNQIKNEYPEIFSKIENISIPITVLRCNYTKKSHMQYLFTIFHRLNSGGNKLNNQEIRNCIYSGKFNNLLKEIASDEKSQEFFNYKNTPLSKSKPLHRSSYRYQFEELYLRVLAFSDRLDIYNGKLSSFLNDFMDDNKNPNDLILTDWKNNLLATLDIVYQDVRISKFSKSVVEAILFGVYKNLDNVNLKNSEYFIERVTELRKDTNFSLVSLKEGLASKEKVKGRLGVALEIFRS